MYVIAGATGHVGGHAARALLDRGEQVRVLVRSASKGQAWAARGAEVDVVDLGDRAGLAAALRAPHGAFLLLPAAPPVDGDFYAEQRALAEAMSGAVYDSGVPHVVLLSSIGADLDAGTGPVLPLHWVENMLRQTGVPLSVLRSYHFQEKVETVLGPVLGDGVYPVFGASADVATPMVATRDIGHLAAQTLIAPPSGSEVVDVEGPWYTERDVADALADALGTAIQVVTIPRHGWVDALVDGGVPPDFAPVLAELYDADERGILRPQGDRTHRARTELHETIREVLSTAHQPAGGRACVRAPAHDT